MEQMSLKKLMPFFAYRGYLYNFIAVCEAGAIVPYTQINSNPSISGPSKKMALKFDDWPLN